MSIGKILVGTLGYAVIVFPLAYFWHLNVFKSTYDKLGYFARDEPIIPLGFLAIIMQGVLLAAIYPLVQLDMNWFAKGLVFGLFAGLFLGSSQIIADAAKRPIEPLSTWFAIEWTYFAIQFALAGLWFGWLYS